MRILRQLTIVGLISLGGCSIYPLPEDVTGFQSKHIVRMTRCQARDAVRAEIQRTLAAWESVVVYKRMTGGEMARWLADNPDNYHGLRLSDFSPQAARLYKFYGDTRISYDFTIDSSEMNAAGFDLSLLRTFTRGSDLFGIKLQNERTRQVKRQFRNYDSFDNLARGLPPNYCDGMPTGPNWVHPSTGVSKIATLIREFVDQNQRENLGSASDPLNAEMNDTIVFTTKAIGNFDPTWSRDAIPGAFVPSEISVTADNHRLDVHTIIVLIQLPNQRDKILLFDAEGHISAIGKNTIDAKFREIRDNNYKDDFSKVTSTVSRLTP
jgi:hypothetical protein